MAGLRRASTACTLTLLALGCSEPPCPEGALAPAWSNAPLAGLVPPDVHVCEMPADEGATHARFWVESSVHDANMANVDRAQSTGWSRTGDNWYGSSGGFDTPKWSEFEGPGGSLRLDIHESNGGALVDVVFTPGATAAADGRSDLERVQDALGAVQEAQARRPPGGGSDDRIDAPLPIPETAGRRGNPDAPVVVHVFVDYQSPFDARYLPALDRLNEELGDRVLIVIRNNPLPFHRDAVPAAQAALAVRAQLGDDAFWQYQRTLFDNSRALSRADLVRYASEIEGLDAARFASDMRSSTYAEAVQADQREASRVGASGTPTTFVGSQRIAGAQPYERLRAAVDAALGS